MVRITFHENSPLPFRQWDIEGSKIVRCDPDPEVSWVGVGVSHNDSALVSAFRAGTLELCIEWADGSTIPLPVACVMRLPGKLSNDAVVIVRERPGGVYVQHKGIPYVLVPAKIEAEQQ